MLATWPMVIGALIAGAILGLLVPSPKPSTPIPPPAVSADKPEPKVKRDVASVPPKENLPAKDTVATQVPSQGSAEPKPTKDVPCNQQTWPYYTSSCIDRSAPTPSFQATNTRPADPSVALRADEPKQEEKKADEPKQTEKKSAPALPAAPSTIQPAPAPRPTAAQTGRTPTTAQSSADGERQLEQQRPRQQRTQPRYTRVEPPDDGAEESPRVVLRNDGTRIYVLPEGRPLPQGYWRSW